MHHPETIPPTQLDGHKGWLNPSINPYPNLAGSGNGRVFGSEFVEGYLGQYALLSQAVTLSGEFAAGAKMAQPSSSRLFLFRKLYPR